MQFTVDLQDIKVAVDVVALAYSKGELHILLVQRKYEPFAGRWVIPGGFVETDEELEDAAIRELREETNLKGDIPFFTQSGAYGKVDRDPRKRIVSVAYIVLLNHLPKVKGETDAQDAKWYALDKLPAPLGFDHDFILEKAINKVRYLVRDTDAGRYLLPERFTPDDYSELLCKYLDTPHEVEDDMNNLIKREIIVEDGGELRYS